MTESKISASHGVSSKMSSEKTFIDSSARKVWEKFMIEFSRLQKFQSIEVLVLEIWSHTSHVRYNRLVLFEFTT